MEDRSSKQTSGDLIPEPEPAHLPPDDNDSDEREATELRDTPAHAGRTLGRTLSPGTPMLQWYDPIKRFWRHHIRLSVPHIDCRDHLANERTFLGYYRTSVGLSMLGVLIAQLYRLQHSPTPSPTFGYFLLGKPLGAILQCAALIIVAIGAIRFGRQQKLMARGRVQAGGWEIWTITAFTVVLLTALFALHVGVDIYKET